MTMRAVFLGLLGAALLCGFTYFNDAIMHQTFLVGNHLPISVYGIFILFVLFINPFLFRFFKRLALTSKELVVIIALALAVGSIPSSGLLRTFSTSLILPHQYNKTEPGWKEQKVMEMVPKQMLADISKNEDDVLNGFIQGMGTESKHIPFLKAPWYAWKRPLMFWLPIILALWIGMVGLSVVVHRQWSDHEHLPLTLYFQYNRGYDQQDGWASKSVPKMAFNNAVYIKQRLKAQGILDQADKISGWERFKNMRPNPSCMLSLGVGLFLVLLFTFLRLRFPKWPLHPVIFLVWATYPIWMFFFSFFPGGLIKIIVTKYGGIKFYRKLKPLMVGLIAGEISAAVIPIIFGLVYSLITGEPPKAFHILPT